LSIKRTEVLLISKKTSQATQIREKLALIPGYRVRFEETAETAMALLTQGTMDCVIFNFENFGLVQIELVKGIKQIAKISQILVITDKAEEAAFNKVKEEKNLILIETPLLNVERDIVGLCARLIGAHEPKTQRDAKRHPANQKAAICFLDSDKLIHGLVKDISDKGACIEVNTSAIKVDDKIRITIKLDKLNRQRVVTGEIRWIKPSPGRSLIGVKFFKTETPAK
jgi:response regulator RpfG family c-di-GMP phosphodiesterase